MSGLRQNLERDLQHTEREVHAARRFGDLRHERDLLALLARLRQQLVQLEIAEASDDGETEEDTALQGQLL